MYPFQILLSNRERRFEGCADLNFHRAVDTSFAGHQKPTLKNKSENRVSQVSGGTTGDDYAALTLMSQQVSVHCGSIQSTHLLVSIVHRTKLLLSLKFKRQERTNIKLSSVCMLDFITLTDIAPDVRFKILKRWICPVICIFFFRLSRLCRS